MAITTAKISLTFNHRTNGSSLSLAHAQTKARQLAQMVIASGGQALPRQLVQRGIEIIDLPLVQDHPQKQLQLKLLLEEIILIALTAENIPQALLAANLAGEIEIHDQAADIIEKPLQPNKNKSKFKLSHSVKSNLVISGAALALGAMLTTAAPIAYFGYIMVGLGILGIGSAIFTAFKGPTNHN